MHSDVTSDDKKKRKMNDQIKSDMPDVLCKKTGKVNKDKQYLPRDQPPQRVDHVSNASLFEGITHKNTPFMQNTTRNFKLRGMLLRLY